MYRQTSNFIYVDLSGVCVLENQDFVLKISWLEKPL